MGIPKKGSRIVNVGGRIFRFLVKETHVPDHRDQKELSVTVQEDVPKPGNVLQFRAWYGVPVTSNSVARMIRRAIKRGWEPAKRGGAFVLSTE